MSSYFGSVPASNVSIAGISGAPDQQAFDSLFNASLTVAITAAYSKTGAIVYTNGDGTLAVLDIGTAGQVLKVVSGLPAWTAP